MAHRCRPGPLAAHYLALSAGADPGNCGRLHRVDSHRHVLRIEAIADEHVGTGAIAVRVSAACLRMLIRRAAEGSCPHTSIYGTAPRSHMGAAMMEPDAGPAPAHVAG